jgi:hypothetical protein
MLFVRKGRQSGGLGDGSLHYALVVTFCSEQRSLQFFLQLRGPDTTLSRKCLYYLTPAQYYKSFFCNMHKKKICDEN